MIIRSGSEIMYFFSSFHFKKGLAKVPIEVCLIYGFHQKGEFFGTESGYILYVDATYIYILTVYSPFSDRVGLPFHNIDIPSPFTSIMDIFFVNLKFGHISFYTLTMLLFAHSHDPC